MPQDFKLIDTNQYALRIPGAGNRFWHLCTIRSASGLRDFIHYVDLLTVNIGTGQGIYLEEFTGGQLTSDSTITDDALWNDLTAFLVETGIKGDKMMHFIGAKKKEMGYG